MSKLSNIDRLFETIVDRHNDSIRRTCDIYATPWATSDDMYQEVMLSIWRGLKSFRGEAALSTWIYRTTINTCITYLRTMSRHSKSVSIDATPDVAQGEGAGGYDDDEYARMHTLINKLNDIDKAIVMLWLDEQTYDHIAGVTGLSRNVVASRLNRIKKRLKREF